MRTCDLYLITVLLITSAFFLPSTFCLVALVVAMVPILLVVIRTPYDNQKF
jgi:hypothetical protein